MPRGLIWLALFLATIFLPQAHAAHDRLRNCQSDRDCVIVMLRCQCMYCARPDDQANRIVDAVNSRFALQFTKMSKCSASETRKCATAGACAMTGQSVAVCQDQKCAVLYKANSGTGK